ncbi:hypothetical protein FKM82_008365 [Ascaphus truei]
MATQTKTEQCHSADGTSIPTVTSHTNLYYMYKQIPRKKRLQKMNHSNTTWASQSYVYKNDTFFLVSWVFVRIFFFLNL